MILKSFTDCLTGRFSNHGLLFLELPSQLKTGCRSWGGGLWQRVWEWRGEREAGSHPQTEQPRHGQVRQCDGLDEIPGRHFTTLHHWSHSVVSPQPRSVKRSSSNILINHKMTEQDRVEETALLNNISWSVSFEEEERQNKINKLPGLF